MFAFIFPFAASVFSLHLGVSNFCHKWWWSCSCSVVLRDSAVSPFNVPSAHVPSIKKEL